MTELRPPIPKLTAKGIGITIAVWLAYSFISAIPLQIGARIPFIWALSGQLYTSITMALLSLPVWILVIQLMDRKNFKWKIIAHLLIAPIYGVIIYELYYLMVNYVSDEQGAKAFARSSAWIILYNILIYIIQFSIYHYVQTIKILRFKERQALELSALTKSQELALLKSQLNPHFLFNTLNSISAMVTQDAEKTRSMIAQLGELLRYTLEISKKDFVLLKDEMEFIKSYLELEKQRFGDRMLIEYRIQDETLNTKVPPMILQPLIENAIKHGIEPSEQGGKITLEICNHQGNLSVKIRNSIERPARLSKPEPEGIGLQNIDARLRKIYGQQSGLSTKMLETGEFEAEFVIPSDKN